MEISKDIKYIGVNDYKVDLFEGQYIVPNGIAYNSYVIIDQKIAVMDTVDSEYGDEWLMKLQNVLLGKEVDYLVVLHMEPDHSANIKRFVENYPNAKLIGNQKTFKMINQFFDFDLKDKMIVVNDGDSISLGEHELTFVFAPMVHWPEVMVAYESKEKILFSADGFGKFGALDKDEPWLEEARRYYIGIVGKYGKQVQDLLKKASTLDIQKICPLHGPILTENLGYYLGYYDKWSKYEPEEDGILVAYTSIYGHTKKAVEYLVSQFEAANYHNYLLVDLARTDMHYAIGKAFQYSKLILATTTYNNSIFPKMNDFINRLVERNFQNRFVGIIENGSWNPTAAKTIIGKFVDSKEVVVSENVVTIHSAMNDDNKLEIEKLAQEFMGQEKVEETNLDLDAIKKIGYGLYVVTSNDGVKDNGLIINTVVQLTNSPVTVGVAINKENYSHDVILKTGKMNVCTLDIDAPFSVIEQFGFKSGRDVDKFADEKVTRSTNGIAYLTKNSNSYMSLSVNNVVDLGTHSLFVCQLKEANVLNNKDTMTYDYYQKHVKPGVDSSVTKGWVCTICGYVYEGEEVPDDYVCPLCLHGKEYFEEIK